MESRYRALCAAAGRTAADFTPAALSAAQLSEMIAALEKDVVRQAEQAYISDCVSEVMSEMGYAVIGDRSVTKRSGKRFTSKLYAYGAGTAINVTYDAAGQIALELGGLDRADRMPTAAEAGVLETEMESFCAEFADFEARLAKKGIVPETRVALAPPAAEYATIINLTDYTITAAQPVRSLAVRASDSRTPARRALRQEDDD
jgi:hypothetical protein